MSYWSTIQKLKCPKCEALPKEDQMSITRTLKRGIGSQFAHSRNLKEGLGKKLSRIFWATLYLFKGLKIAVSQMRRECLGSRVIYEGKKCYVSNWANSDAPTLGGPDRFYEKHCPREKITNVMNLRELYHRFEFGLDFYMGNWYSIDVNKKLYGFGD